MHWYPKVSRERLRRAYFKGFNRESGVNPEQYPLLYVPHKGLLLYVIEVLNLEKAQQNRDESENLPKP